MFYMIPGELISLITFPGVIIHEIAHRFFCDIHNVPVFSIHYFIPFSKTAGCVRHAYTDNFTHSFFISIGPLLINSLVCILLTLPYGTMKFLGTDFVHSQFNFLYYILAWIGYSAGVHAFPSNQDMQGLDELATGYMSKTLTYIVSFTVQIANLDYVGFVIAVGYAMGLSMALPALFLINIEKFI
jgi:hypothetical protein